MRRLVIAALVLPVLLGAAARPSPVAYSLSPEMAAGVLQALDVEVRFHGEASGTTDFAWARNWGGENRLWRWARDLKVEGARSVEHPEDGLWRIHADPGASLVVRYRVVSGYDHDPTTADSRQPTPVIRPTWFYVAGEALFAAPRSQIDAPGTFEWKGAGSGLGFASDLQHLSGPTWTGTRPGVVGDVRESIVIGGRDLQVTGSLDGPDKVRVAMLGAARSAALDAKARRVIAMERRFWGEKDGAPFLVTAIPLAADPAAQSLSGTGRTDAFALWLDPRLPVEKVTWLLAHEYFHTWNAVALGGFGRNRTAGPIAWFSEGFTDYYARALLVRSGMISPQAFAKLWTASLRDYAASPVKTAPNSRIAADFWNDDAVQSLPYQRGAQLAALWNARLRRESGGRLGLDDIMRAQFAWAKAHPNPDLAAPDLFAPTAARLGFDLSDDVRRYVKDGEAITLPRDVFGPCASVVEASGPTFDRGFDAEATSKAGNVIQGVKPDSPAYAAGLRDGMTFIRREGGEAGDPTIPYVFTVEDRGARRTIRWLPQGSSLAVRPVVRIKPGADPKACARSLSGL